MPAEVRLYDRLFRTEVPDEAFIHGLADAFECAAGLAREAGVPAIVNPAPAKPMSVVSDGRAPVRIFTVS